MAPMLSSLLGLIPQSNLPAYRSLMQERLPSQDVFLDTYVPAYNTYTSNAMNAKVGQTVSQANLENAVNELATQFSELRRSMSRQVQPLRQTGSTFAVNRNVTPDGRVICRLCDKPGHIARECRTAQTCRLCGRQGHLARDCRRPSNNNYSNDQSRTNMYQRNGERSQGLPSFSDYRQNQRVSFQDQRALPRLPIMQAIPTLPRVTSANNLN